MEITVQTYNGSENTFNCEWYEFRSNTSENWIRLKSLNGVKATIKDIAAIRYNINYDTEKNNKDIDELLDELIYLYSVKEDYINRCDYLNWSQKKEDEAIQKFYECKNRIKELIN